MNLIFRICLLFLLPCVALAQNEENNTLALYQKAQTAFAGKDFASFLKLTEKMMELGDNHSGVQYQYARALAVTGKASEALQVLERVAAKGGAPAAEADAAFVDLKERSEFKAVLQRFASNRTRHGKSDVAFLVPGKDLIPEGIACDLQQRKCYLGSTYRRKILVIDSTGAAKEFVAEKQDGLWAVLGMEVDPKRRNLWVATANAGAPTPMIDPEPETEGLSAIFKYNVDTGKLLKKYPTGSKATPLFFNDVAVAPGGDVFVSESNTGAVYRISAATDTLEKVVDGGSMNYANGIAVSPDGKLLFVSYMEATVAFDTTGFGMQKLKAPETVQTGSFDGMIFYRNSLVGIQMLTGGLDRIVRLRLTDDLRGVVEAEVLQVGHPLFLQPTTGDMLGDEFHYIANSQISSFDEQGKIFQAEKLMDPIILKIPIPQ